MDVYDRELELFEVLWGGVQNAMRREMGEELFGKLLKPENDPVMLSRIAREEPRLSEALAGLREAINDTYDQIRHLKESDKHEIDGQLSEKGFPTLISLLNAKDRRVRRLVDRGHLCTDEEYYLAKSATDDLDSGFMDEERIALEHMMGQFVSANEE